MDILLTLFTYLVTIPSTLCVCWYLWHLHSKRKVPNVPCNPCIPFLGHYLHFSQRNKLIPHIEQWFTELGDTFLAVLGSDNFIVTKDYKNIEKILSSTKYIEKLGVYKFAYNWLGRGLITSGGTKWKQRRRILTPTYHFQILEQFVPVFDSVTDILVEKLKKEKNKTTLNIYPYISLCTLDVICETAMGVPINALKNRESEYIESVQVLGEIIMDRTLSPIQQFDFSYKFTKNYKREQKALKILHGHTESVIRQRKKLLASEEDSTSTDDDFGKRKKTAFLDMLLKVTENGVPMSDKDIREEVDTFMFAGHDTTAAGISFALFEISRHPEVQRKIMEEQREIFADGQRPLTFQDLTNMKYLDLVIKETLRLYPSVPFFARHAHEDIKLHDNLTVPKGFSLFIAAYHIQRDPKIFEKPDEFIPERFAREENPTQKQAPYSFIAFSAGPRNCIGQKFALAEMKATLSKILRNFEVSSTVPAHELSLTADTILESENGIIMRLKERDNIVIDNSENAGK